MWEVVHPFILLRTVSKLKNCLCSQLYFSSPFPFQERELWRDKADMFALFIFAHCHFCLFQSITFFIFSIFLWLLPPIFLFIFLLPLLFASPFLLFLFSSPLHNFSTFYLVRFLPASGLFFLHLTLVVPKVTRSTCPQFFLLNCKLFGHRNCLFFCSVFAQCIGQEVLDHS